MCFFWGFFESDMPKWVTILTRLQGPWSVNCNFPAYDLLFGFSSFGPCYVF